LCPSLNRPEGAEARFEAPIYACAIGGSTRSNSSTEQLLAAVLSRLEARGARTDLLAGHELELPIYSPGIRLDRKANRLIECARHADAILIGSPGYHGSISGLVKNALDYLEELRDDRRPYLSGRPVGLVVTAYGWQAAVATLGDLRQVTHALRGWPTPLGIAVNMTDLAAGFRRMLDDHDLDERIQELAAELYFMAQACRAGGLRAPVS
jgi:FMN reductase